MSLMLKFMSYARVFQLIVYCIFSSSLYYYYYLYDYAAAYCIISFMQLINESIGFKVILQSAL